MTGFGQALEVKFCHPGINRVFMGKVVHGILPLGHNLIMTCPAGFGINELIQFKNHFLGRGPRGQNPHQSNTQEN